MSDSKYGYETDVLIVGSGAAGLTASLRAKHHGLRSILVEKGDKIGGASALSGGELWIPGNPLARARGFAEDREEVLKYFEAGIGRNGDPTAASSLARRVAFLDNGPRMVQFLQDQGFRWHLTRGYPDYYPELPGGSATGGGRSVEPEVFDMKKLGDWENLVLSPPGASNVPSFRAYEAAQLTRIMASVPDFARVMATIIAPWLLRRTLLGQRPVTLGRSLVAQLLYLNKQHGSVVWRNAPLVSLLQDGATGAVFGARVKRDGQETTVRARRGVLLCAGGFARNKTLREAHGPAPTSTAWTSAPPGDNGDAIIAGIQAGAATALMDDAWWGPTIFDPVTGAPFFALLDRARPFCVIVDSRGQRFLNEAESYTDAGHHQYAHHQKPTKAIPAWLVMDQRYRNRYMLGTLMARQPLPPGAEAAGRVFQADTLSELAAKIGVDAAGLETTVTRWNAMSHKGVDEDFGKGASAYDRFFGDPSIKPNPNMGALDRPPFYATPLYPGDLGTKGGLLTDERARVLDTKAGQPIAGLYGAGNTTASVMGRSYLGSGSTLGPACTFAFVAVDDMAASKA